jgi:putative endonuclease
MNSWFVYIIRSSDDSLYTGVTTDVKRRFEQHANKTGAKFFSGRKPEKIEYCQEFPDQGSALKREAEIKKLSRTEKLALIGGR